MLLLLQPADPVLQHCQSMAAFMTLLLYVQSASAVWAPAAVAKIISPEQLCQLMLRLWHCTT